MSPQTRICCGGLCAKDSLKPPTFVDKNDEGRLERLDVTITKEGEHVAAFLPLDDEQIRLVCEQRIHLRWLEKPRAPTQSEGKSAYVPPQSTTPSSFNIQRLQFPGYNVVLGNLWVPGNMPAAHNAHMSQFRVSNSGFDLDHGNIKHFVHMLTASSDNFVSRYHGKEMIFGPCYICFAPDGALQYAATLETWLFAPPTPTDVRVWHGWPTATSPATGAVISKTAATDFFVGANRSQDSVYWHKAATSSAWITTPAVNSSNPSFSQGKAGATYFVAHTPNAGVGNWTLTFTNVSQWTQP
ncbi:MAG: hypothetical protein EAZ30_00235 [Betaproteobacteria bacterium]|nr:MAG: hypothetical protein EAZ30_00235 [Betaproteobacteria bacterium]